MRIKISHIIPIVLLLTACNSRTYDEISEQIPPPQMVTYNKDVKPIIDQNCIMCHAPGGAASFQPWTSYTQVKNNIDKILDRIQRPVGDPQKMPQGGALSQSQIDVFIQWKQDGLQEN